MGGLFLSREGAALAGLAAQPRRLALLALLASAGEQGMRREKLTSYLWPDADEERGRRSLAQALYSIRRELGDDEVIVGIQDLRLNPEQITSDLSNFRRAVEEGDLASAAALYAGPFLDGFRLSGLPDLERWIEQERQSLFHLYATTLERLATRASNSGNFASAISWWRKLASLDPANGRVAVSLMSSMVALNDRAGALRQAEIFESIYSQETGSKPTGDVAAFIEKLRSVQPASNTGRSTAISASTSSTFSAPPPSLNVESPAATSASIEKTAGTAAHGDQPFRGPQRSSRSWVTTAGIAAVVALAGAAVVLLPKRNPGVAPNTVVAVGRLSEFGRKPGAVGALADLLATNLARVEGLRVVSAARIQELSGSDTTAYATASAAREAGATELIEGALYAQEGGRLRLDLRRVDLVSGRLRDAQSVQGADLFALVDSGTARLVSTYGASAPTSSISEVTTGSSEAYQLYATGLRQFFAGDVAAAERLFGAALREDPNFAMAAYYYARSSNEGWVVTTQRLQRAVDLSAHATDRERLLILAGWAGANSSPQLAVYAESLVMKYPDDVQGYLTRSQAAAQQGDRAKEMAAIRRVIAMDSVGIIRGRSGCAGCEAMGQLVQRYLEVDSATQAITEAKRWTRLQPKSILAWRSLASAYEIADRNDEAIAAWNTATSIDSAIGGAKLALAEHWIRVNEHARADSILVEISSSAGRDSPDTRDALWYLSLSARQQGRLNDALSYAQQYRALTSRTLPSTARGSAPPTAILIALAEQERGRAAVAAALIDSISRWRAEQSSPSNVARNITWNGVHLADALALARDTARLAQLEDSLRTFGAQSAFPRDRLLHHHVHALRLLARGDQAGAISSFRSAIWSTTFGYTRTNYLLGATLLKLNRAKEAIEVLQPALRGSIEASNMYITRTELHEMLARAWDSAGNADSATTHYRTVAKAWGKADSLLQPRRANALKRAAELGGR